MSFKLKTLTHRTEDAATCYICEASLENYINSIPDKYKDYNIQRGIVNNNFYLERLVNTILEGKYIPIIVLISDKYKYEQKDNELNLEEYNILDGLQRSNKMKLVYNAFKLYLLIVDRKSKEIIENLTKYKLSKEYKSEIEEYGTEITYLTTIIEFYKNQEINREIFSQYSQIFEVWTNLTESEQVNKMLILNAGHKSMDLKHQLELLFLNIFPNDILDNFIRSRDINSTYFYKNKLLEDVHLTHFISALLSFDKSEPILVDQKYLQNIHENYDSELESIKIFVSKENINKFIKFFKELDNLIFNDYGKLGLEWIGRESVLIGMFASYGKVYTNKYSRNINNLDECLDYILDILKKNIDKFNIQEFNLQKENVNIAKVNIGDLFKYSTYFFFYNLLLNNEIISWEDIFKKSKSEIKNDCK